MRLKTALVSLLLLCPCALCYGQLRFASVGGKEGYSAMRARYTADLDNGWILIPQYGYYRMSDDDPDDGGGSTSRYGLEVLYEMTDTVSGLAGVMLQPQALGYEGAGYEAGMQVYPFYYWGGLKNPVVQLKAGQSRQRTYVDFLGNDLPGQFRQVGTWAALTGEVDIARRWHLQATWQKVIKYSSRVPKDVSFSWAEVPYMTAVLQGYIKDALAARLSFQTDLAAPYVTLVRYHYERSRQVSSAIGAGLRIRLWGIEVTGGVEIFEPRQDEIRKTYFSLSVEAPL